MLVIRDLSVTYPSRNRTPVHALENINLDIMQGEIVVALGASGCGKSTLLSSIAGFLPVESGSIVLNDQPVRKPGSDRGVVFQKDTLLPWKSVLDNVSLGLELSGVAKDAAHTKALELLELVGLEEFANSAPYELSGGMRQRVGIARALATDPALLLMDEPFGALDSFTREQMQDLLIDVWGKTRKTIFLITHSIEEALSLGTRIIVMSPRPGRIIKRYATNFIRTYLETRDWGAIRTSQEFIFLKQEIRELIHASFDDKSATTPTEEQAHAAL
jgi:taurine transport system ATP-binding protein